MMERHRIEARLMKHGYKMLGSGCSSAVWAKGDSTRCIKVGTCADWEPYIRWAHQAGYAGTFAPRVYAFHRWSNWLYTASVERLTVTVTSNRFNTPDDDGEDLYQMVDSRHWSALEPRFPGISAFTAAATCAGMNGDWHCSNWMLHEERLVLVDTYSRGQGFGVRRWRPQHIGAA